VGFLLRCFQQLSAPHIATQRVPLAGELVYQRCVLPGPLVLWKAPLNALAPTPDMDRTVSRRSEPSSRTAFMGEQPNPWDVLPPQVASNFYPLSDGPSTRHRRITKAGFRPCSTCRSCSQAPLCLYTLRLISVQPEGTFAHLRYLLGGDRPSQTAHLKLSSVLFQGAPLEF
jgi:hypothetical protein